MNDRPTALELLEAVRRFLSDEAVPNLAGHLSYQARVAANVVAIVAQELRCESRQLEGEWTRLNDLLEEDAAPPADRAELAEAISARTERLVERIRAGDGDAGPFRDALIAHLEQTVADKLEVAKPPR
jgi:hypothetical protein